VPTPGKELLVVENLKKWFPVRRSLADVLAGRERRYVRAVDGISFTVVCGEVFCLVGESGCGKTTTGKLIVRALRPTSGRMLYRVSEEAINELRALHVRLEDNSFIDLAGRFRGKADKLLRREVQMILQDPYGSLNPRQTIRDVLEEPLIIHGVGRSRDERLELVVKALEDVKLTPPEEFLDRYPHQLSGGQRQRVNIARALLLKPKLIVADEPVSMLDVSIRAEILQLMLELRDVKNLTYVFITHDLAVANNICDRIAVMYLGKIVELGPATEVIRNPLHPYTKALIAAIPEPDPRKGRAIREVPIKGEVPNAVNVPPGCRLHPRCPYAEERCRREEPELKDVGGGHLVACHLY